MTLSTSASALQAFTKFVANEPLPFTLRLGRSEDLPQLREIALLAYPDTQETLSSFLSRASVGLFLVAADSSGTPFGYLLLLALESHQVPATVEAWPENPLRLYVHDICIDPAMRKRGIGRALTLWVEDFARELGATEVFGDAVANSLGFWRKQGWELSQGGHGPGPSSTRIRKAVA